MQLEYIERTLQKKNIDIILDYFSFKRIITFENKTKQSGKEKDKKTDICFSLLTKY